MSKIVLTETLEKRFSIESPRLSVANTVQTPTLRDGSCYNITLTPSFGSLHVTVRWVLPFGASGKSDMAGYRTMRIVPHKRGSEPFTVGACVSPIITGYNVAAVHVYIEKILHNNKYCFDIVLSSNNKQPINDNRLVNDNQSRKDSDPRTEETMLALLKDVHSVNLCFAFESDKTYPGLEVWAHRVVLSRYKKIANMIQKATEAMSEETNNPKSGLLIPNSADPLVIDLNTVTWEELLMAADFFGVTDLRDYCESKVISAINKSNVIDTLFNVGSCFDKVKESALDYIVQNMVSLVVDGKDPFESYKYHPECHDLMVEVMRRRAKMVL
ncbi:hypothetical protein BGZ58_006275 [Dissophora ornata]|nr:hypothetical protein BGZ58_006275 [Dissophora ornata]